MKVLGLVQKAQAYRLSGYGTADHEHELAPYVGLGTPVSPAYDLGAPGAVMEVKRALTDLAAKENVPVETLQLDDVWDVQTAIEFALAVSRHRSKMPWALSDPFMSAGPYPSVLQPTVNGLELLAGAANLELDKTDKLVTYEAWRGGAFAPPSVISRPAASTGLRPTYNVSPRTFLPSDATAEEANAAALFEGLEKSFLELALVSTTEDGRAAAKAAFLNAASEREGTVGRSIAASGANARAAADCSSAGGVWDDASGTCAIRGAARVGPAAAPTEPSSTGALILLGGAAVALYFVMRK